MPNPLAEFDSPRKVRNHASNGGDTIPATTRWELGNGLVAALTPEHPEPGQPQFMSLNTVTPPLQYGPPVSVGTANAQGSSTAVAPADHVHNHGTHTNPTNHALATEEAHGFMSSDQAAKLDNIVTTLMITFQETLASGEFILNPGVTITSNTRVWLQRHSRNGSTRKGELRYTLTPGAAGVGLIHLKSLDDDDNVEPADVSIVNVFVIEPYIPPPPP